MKKNKHTEFTYDVSFCVNSLMTKKEHPEDTVDFLHAFCCIIFFFIESKCRSSFKTGDKRTSGVRKVLKSYNIPND